MHGAEFSINGDGRGALAAFNMVKRGANDMSHEVNKLGENLIEAFSVAAIVEAAKAAVEFAESIKKAGDRLNITTDNIQALRIIARDAGKDLGFMEKSFQLLEKSARMALGGSGAQKKAFKNLGISDEDLKHLDKVSLLSTIMHGAGKLGTGAANGELANIFGDRMAGSLMTMQPKLAGLKDFTEEQKKRGAIASNDDIEKLAELKDRWDEIMDVIKTAAIPVLSWLLDTILDFGRGVKQMVEVVSTYAGAMVGAFTKFDLKGFLIEFATHFNDGMEAIVKNVWGIVTGKTSITEALGNVTDTYIDRAKGLIKAGFGDASDVADQAVQDLLLKQAEDDKKLQQEREKRRKERADKEEAKLTTNRHANTDQKPHKDKMLKETLAGDAAIKVGGLLNADTNYRVKRVQFEMAADVKRTADNTEEMKDKLQELCDKYGDPDNGTEDGPGLGAGL